MKSVIEAVNSDQNVRLCMYTVNSTSETRVKKVLALYLKRQACETLLSPVYTCVKELLINAVKANYKNIYFEEYGSQHGAASPADYQTALKLFKLEMTRENERNLGRIARKRGMKAEVLFRAEGATLNVTVANPVSMTPQELESVHRKLEEARECSDISDYFLIHSDDPNTEGAGIGLVLISMILKSLGVPDPVPRIRSGQGQTLASLQIPLGPQTLEHYMKSTKSAPVTF